MIERKSIKTWKQTKHDKEESCLNLEVERIITITAWIKLGAIQQGTNIMPKFSINSTIKLRMVNRLKLSLFLSYLQKCMQKWHDQTGRALVVKLWELHQGWSIRDKIVQKKYALSLKHGYRRSIRSILEWNWRILSRSTWWNELDEFSPRNSKCTPLA